MTAEDYVRDVGFALRDLPWRTKRELLSELRVHLSELPDESNLRVQLGTPETYAADLRVAAGLDRRRGVIAFLRARRPRNLVITAAALTAIGLVVSAVAWIESYQPLTVGFGYRYPKGTVEAPAGDSASVVFHGGRPFQFGILVWNSGRFRVRILGVPYPQGEPFKARLMMGRSFPLNRAGMGAVYQRFRPFDLEPGYVRFLFFKGVYANCSRWPGAGVTTLFDFPVRYGFLWRTATADIPLPEKLAFVFRNKNNCR